VSISYDSKLKLFHLQGKSISYAFQIVQGGFLAHLYFGKKVRGDYLHRLLVPRWRPSFSPNPFPEEPLFTLDTLPQEYPSYGTSDFRHPAYQVQLENGTTVTEFTFFSYTIVSGKPKLAGLPATYTESDDEAETLEIILRDETAGLELILGYTVFSEHNVVARTSRMRNIGKHSVDVLSLLSASIDLPHHDYEFVHLAGAWVRERHIVKRPLAPGMQSIDSKRGSSSHQNNPFIALASKGASEQVGEVYGFNLVYSGNFIAQAEVDQFATTRVSIGLNPFDFRWRLEPEQIFQAPEAILAFSDEGFGGLSRTYHRLYRTRLCRGKFRDKVRPILINNWEATYFDFDANKIEEIARAGKELGLELFVLDDGWFGKRDSDNCSLGDWTVDQNKLPNGLTDLAERIQAMGMEFGLWFEPEMVSPDSDLYRSHPDWCLHVPNKRRTEARNQLVLDFSREDVRNYIYEQISTILRSASISYVKWDMNRNMTEIGSALLPPELQKETAHRYMLGLYELLERITSEFPDVLFESCSGGGGRFDPGMLFYMPQTWTSDNSDAIERLKIQYGTSMVYPVSTMGSHVSAVPNHQVERITSLAVRGHVAMSGNFGYELDLSKMSEAEKAIVREQVTEYKEIRQLVQQGDMYRLLSPFEGNETSWMFVSDDKAEAYMVYVRVLAIPNAPITRLRLKGLDPDKLYALNKSDVLYRGDELMYAGLVIPELKGDFTSVTFHFSELSH
jgi:alpha-galactosidase